MGMIRLLQAQLIFQRTQIIGKSSEKNVRHDPCRVTNEANFAEENSPSEQSAILSMFILKNNSPAEIS